MSDGKTVDKAEVSIEKLIGRLEVLELENRRLRKQNLIVGVRWYGYGAMSIGLSIEIGGRNKVDLEGYGAKGVIDYPTWMSLQKAKIVKEGVLVRDDSVIEELNIFGDIGHKDVDKNCNSFTDAEIIQLLGGNRKKIEKVLNKVTHFQIVARFQKLIPKSEAAEKGDIGRYVSDRYEEIETKFRWGFLDKWEIIAAAENAGFDVSGVNAEVLRDRLVKRELEILKGVR